MWLLIREQLPISFVHLWEATRRSSASLRISALRAQSCDSDSATGRNSVCFPLRHAGETNLKPSVRQEILVGEDAVEGGAADGKLAGGAKLVAAVEVEDVLHMVANNGVEGEIGGAGDGLRVE